MIDQVIIRVNVEGGTVETTTVESFVGTANPNPILNELDLTNWIGKLISFVLVFHGKQGCFENLVYD